MLKWISIITTTIVLLSCQTKKSDRSKELIIELNSAKNTETKFDFIKLLNTIPTIENDFYFNSNFDSAAKGELIYLSNSIIDKLNQDSIVFYEFNQPYKIKTVRQFRDTFEQKDSIKIGFYKLIKLDTISFNVLTAFISVGQPIKWKILTFDKKGNQISALDRFDEFYTVKDTIFGLWWYASDNYPNFETWIRNKSGEFVMVRQSEKAPDQLKERIKTAHNTR